LPVFRGQFAAFPGAVREYKIQEFPFLRCGPTFEQDVRVVRQLQHLLAMPGADERLADRAPGQFRATWREQHVAPRITVTVAAVAVGHRQNGAAVVNAEHGCRGIAEHTPTMLPDGVPDHPSFEDFDNLLPDLRKATADAQRTVA